MGSEWKVHVTALAIMATVGIAAPAAALIATDWRTLPLIARDAMAKHARIELPTVFEPRIDTHEATRGTVTLHEVTVRVPSAARHLGHVESPSEPACYWHKNEMGSGRVRICDVPRSRIGELKRLEVGKRGDLPSPSGLIRP